MSATLPKVAVLLPTFNGASYLKEQIESIIAQTSVKVVIYYHDDGSDDDTVSILQSYENYVVEIEGPPTGGAAKNVYYLLTQVDWAEFDFVALADQDDIWLPDKLSRALSIINNIACAAYSSNVQAFWEDGSTKEIIKSQKQKQFDFLFEAGGPGNTHVYSILCANAIREFLIELNPLIRSKIELHDWLIYAYCRHNGITWIIDDYSSLCYRQHGSNVMGASGSYKQWFRRATLLFGDWYFEQVRLIMIAISFRNGKQRFFTDYAPLDSFFWVLRTFDLRRKKSEAIVLSAAIFLRFLKHFYGKSHLRKHD